MSFKKQQRFKIYYHDMYTKEISKVSLSSNDNKRVQTFNRLTIFPPKTRGLKCVKMKS